MSILPGLHPGFFAAGSAQAEGLSFITSATSNGNTITAPVGIVAGDILVIGHCASDEDGTAPAVVTPSGFTVIGSASDSDSGVSIRLSLHQKVAAGTESGVSFNVVDGNNSYVNPNQRSEFAVFRKAPTPAVSVSAQDISTAADIAVAIGSETILSGAGVVPLIALAVMHFNPFDTDNNDPANASMTPSDGSITNGGNGQFNSIRMFYQMYDAGETPANVVAAPNNEAYSMVCAYLQVT